MKFKVLVEYEYPIEHKPPVKAEIVLHGDRVVTDSIKWIEQEPFINKPCASEKAYEVGYESGKADQSIIGRGHWSRKTKVDAYDIAGVKTWGIKCQCDKCDFTTIVVEGFGYYKYCPNCGCRMVEGDGEE